MNDLTAEEQRLEESARRETHWKRWGPYLSERQWGTVREDYSADGDAWASFPHDHSRSRAYRWGEDGLGGICDTRQLVCFALALWNGRDAILKERLFGLGNGEGNHGEDVKECYFYLDSTPTHSWMRFLYKYPQAAFPYRQLVKENARRSKDDPEFELVDTGVLDEGRYFDVFVDYAKAGPDDLLIRINAHNRGPEPADLWLLPTLWFRNTWSWEPGVSRPRLWTESPGVIRAEHATRGQRWLQCDGDPQLLFTQNETHAERFGPDSSPTPYVKDAFHRYVVDHDEGAVDPGRTGTKAAALVRRTVPAGGSTTLDLRFTDRSPLPGDLGDEFKSILSLRRQEADAFFARRAPATLSEDGRRVQRQAFAGLLWSKQFYHFDVRRWLEGDPLTPDPPPERKHGRNHGWQHLHNDDVISMPDAWEYPWYAAWDLAFHCIPFAQIDPEFAKGQLLLFLREWYMHPSGQLPAYEWALGDVNPPVHAWAVMRVYQIEGRTRGVRDRDFLERAFHKLLLNFTWWVNRKDIDENNLFQGGFLGLDNIGVFDRSAPLPTGGHIEQSDATSWMGMYCLNLLNMALELARDNPVYEDVASKFFEHFVAITHAMSHRSSHIQLWDEEHGFYYDVLHFPDGHHDLLKIRSMVGLIPLFGVSTLDSDALEQLPGFRKRMEWFLENVPHAAEHVETRTLPDGRTRSLLSLVRRDRLERILPRVLDEQEFLSPFGVRALSRYHREHPYRLSVKGDVHTVAYEPGESRSALFGGNSNWRGPVWFPLNYLLIESLQRFHHFYGDELLAECPAGSGRRIHLADVAGDLSRRLIRIFTRDAKGRRAFAGGDVRFADDPHWRDHLLFHEYFHGDTGMGMGASHQTGWTALVAKLIEQTGE